MSYAARADLVARYGECELVAVTDKARPPVGEADEAVIARALSDADGEIDARISVRFAVPLTGTVPPVVVDVACRIARYKLHGDKATERICADYEDAMRVLAAQVRTRSAHQARACPMCDRPSLAGCEVA